jgi:O-antigen ligase/polysaccharide polymerase Wzy-like membrane protein
MAVTSLPSRRGGTDPVLIRIALAVALPLIAAGTVLGTFSGNEVIVTAAWLALSVSGVLFIRPVVGIAAMTVLFLLAAYPTPLQALGFLTINNLLGVCLLVLLVARIAETRDLSFLRIRQVRIMIVIGVLLLIGTYVAELQFPLLEETVGKTQILDKTSDMGHDFITRLAFLVFFVVFVRGRSDVKIMCLVLMLGLYAAIPSALVNWWQGTLNRGFRVEASLTSGSNPNRLGMICLIEMTLWWFWSQARPGILRQLVALPAIATAGLVLLATGSRSGLLALGFTGLLLQTGPRRFRLPAWQVGLLAVGGVIAIALIVPEETWQRMSTMMPEKGQIGASSNVMREETLERAVQVAEDYPVFGVGLGNFREVTRQIYEDDFFRPPHNSYLWAICEGGVFVLLAYGWLFWVTWQDMQTIRTLSSLDPEIEVWATALRIVFLLFFFYSAFADLWLNPLTYVLLGLIITMRRYVEGLTRPPAAAPIVLRSATRLPVP